VFSKHVRYVEDVRNDQSEVYEYEMKSQHAGWKKHGKSRVKQCDDDVKEISAVNKGKPPGSSDSLIPLKIELERRIFVGNISYSVSVISAELMGGVLA